jgi:membrane protein
MGVVARLDLGTKITHLRHYFADEIWEKPLDQLPKREARRYRAARVLHSVAQGLFFSPTLPVRAAALTYFTVLSMVPFLAFVFALLKGFGAYDSLMRSTVQPALQSMFAGNPALERALQHILSFVANTGVASLGFFGLVALIYSSVSLLRNIEDAMNHIWGVASGRGLFRQVTDYAAIMLVTPVCLLIAAGLGTTSQVQSVLQALQERFGFFSVVERVAGILGPLFVIFLGLAFLYTVMPNTSVHIRSALVGALVGSVLWYAALIAHVRFQVGVAEFNALYSGFAAVPIFLVWLYVSWQMIMVGALVAATHQQDRAQGRHVREASLDQDFREAVGLSALLRIARAFVRAEAPPTLHELSCSLDAPEQLLEDLLCRAQRAGLVLKTAAGTDAKLVLARMPDQITVKQLLDALRHEPEHARSALPGVDPEARSLLDSLDRELARSPYNLTLSELLSPGPNPLGGAQA